MSHAIIPLNVQALRVNLNDEQGLTPKFKGRVAAFESLPHDSGSRKPSTGAAIVQPLESAATPLAPLKAGIHLHWELPDIYRRGTQSAVAHDVVFPHAPNTWLVIRHLQILDCATNVYKPLKSRAWIVESDHISDEPPKSRAWIVESDGISDEPPARDSPPRPVISVPLPADPKVGEKPYKYMGRVHEYDRWPGPATPDHYLPHYAPNYLTSVGFVGPSFSSYYPECCSVFGFWDHFHDEKEVYDAIQNNDPLQFRTSYQVLGWVRDADRDLFAGFGRKVMDAYDAYVRASLKAKAAITETPASELVRMARQDWHLDFNAKDIAFTLDKDKYCVSLDAPVRGLCNGLVQEIVWNMCSAPASTFFLTNPADAQPNPVWEDNQIRLAVGNTTVEALSALIKDDIVHPGATPQQISDYEVLLDALQLNLLHDLEENGKALISLEEALHTRAFSKVFGGYVWSVEPKEAPGRPVNEPPDGSRGITLPLTIAEHLTVLNRAQKAYDQGRDALDEMRKQLFMDWLRFINAYVDPSGGKLNIDINLLVNFIDNASANCELGHVVGKGAATGVQRYRVDRVSGLITGLEQPADTNSTAGSVWRAYETLVAALKDCKDWEIRATPGPAFWNPTDPVLIMQGDRLEPVRRNGTERNTPVRLSGELLSELVVQYQGSTLTLPAGNIPHQPSISAVTPMRDDVVACVGEVFLLAPMLAGEVADAVAQVNVPANPAKADRAAFITTLQKALGGSSPLDPSPSDTGLFARLHAPGAGPLENAVEHVPLPQDIRFTFTNPAGTGWTCGPVGWSTQRLLRELDPRRVDPFLPVFLVWTGTLNPLKRDKGNDYGPANLTDYFRLDDNAVDYTYTVPASGEPKFTTGTPVTYGGAVVLSRQPTRSLTAQIDQYEKLYPHATVKARLETARAAYARAQIMSQGIGDFNLQQLLRTPIARIPVEDLVKGNREFVTENIAKSATATTGDSWYVTAFNSLSPIAKDLRALNNFGPLRSGFGQIRTLEIIDAFGQRMTLRTKVPRADGSQNAVPAHSLAPEVGDTINAHDIFYPPRLLPPSRVWFKWLSASFDSSVPGFTDDFVEVNAHPATSPVCGWIVPNHLDVSLFFYNADGRPFGSFGVEHGVLKYRTRAGNTANPQDDLALDIGPETGPPLEGVNRHVFDVMWYVYRQTAGFLRDLMQTIATSAGLMNPARYAQEVSLSVLMGQPLALARAVIALETAGGVLPVSQADTSLQAPFSQDILAGRYRYSERQQASAAAFDTVRFPVRLGNLADIDDGLVGFFIDGHGAGSPYSTFYAPHAPENGVRDIEQPGRDTVALTLNATPIALTFLMDPRAPIHATTGILPVETLAIPSDQYADAMGRLELTFFTHPVLAGHGGLVVPLPQEAGYAWSWVQPGQPAPLPLLPNAGNEVATYNYTPQHLFEGWARLAKAPEPPRRVGEAPTRKGGSDVTGIYSTDPLTSAASVGSAPISIAVIDVAANLPLIYAGVTATLRVTLTNAGASISLNTGTSTVLIFLPEYATPGEVRAMSIDVPSWTFAAAPDDRLLTLTYTGSGSGHWVGNFVFDITNVKVAAHAEGDVDVSFRGMEGASALTTPLPSVEAAKPGNASLAQVLQVSLDSRGTVYVSTALDPLANRLFMNVKNIGPEPLYVGTGLPSGAEIAVQFCYGATSGAIAPASKNDRDHKPLGSAWNIEASIKQDQTREGWRVTPAETDDPFPIWRMVPTSTNRNLLGVGDASNVTFEFTNIVTLTTAGHTQMVVTFSGFRKNDTTIYDDLVVVLDVVKENPPQNRGLLDFFGTGSPIVPVASSNTPVDIPLRWSMANVNRVDLITNIPGLAFHTKTYAVPPATPKALDYDGHTLRMSKTIESKPVFITLQARDAAGGFLNSLQYTAYLQLLVFVDPRDNNKEYPIAIFKDRFWMTKNLDYPDAESRVYNDYQPNEQEYGRLYDASSPAKGPIEGWRIPTQADWQSLIDYFGGGTAAYAALTSTRAGSFAAKLGGRYVPSRIESEYQDLDKAGYYRVADGQSWVIFSHADQSISVMTKPFPPAAKFSVRYVKDA